MYLSVFYFGFFQIKGCSAGLFVLRDWNSAFMPAFFFFLSLTPSGPSLQTSVSFCRLLQPSGPLPPLRPPPRLSFPLLRGAGRGLCGGKQIIYKHFLNKKKKKKKKVHSHTQMPPQVATQSVLDLNEGVTGNKPA